MATEIERKFLVKGDGWRGLAEGQYYCQGYIPTKDGRTVRVRIVGERGYLTIKGPAVGNTRSEFEYPIPVEDAREILETLCERPYIEKTRSKIVVGELTWEVDEFAGENQGLILAEVELNGENQEVELPDWIDKEVSGDARYFNSNLAKNPWSSWPNS
jgi:CYTH domain-containing protein